MKTCCNLSFTNLASTECVIDVNDRNADKTAETIAFDFVTSNCNKHLVCIHCQFISWKLLIFALVFSMCRGSSSKTDYVFFRSQLTHILCLFLHVWLVEFQQVIQLKIIEINIFSYIIILSKSQFCDHSCFHTTKSVLPESNFWER